MKKIGGVPWKRVLLILLLAFIITRSLTQAIEEFSSNWHPYYNSKLWEMLANKSQNLQMDDLVNKHGCFLYPIEDNEKIGDTITIRYCLRVNDNSVVVRAYNKQKELKEEVIIARTHYNRLFGVRKVNTSDNDIESNILNLGADLVKKDIEYPADDEENAGTGLRWFQATMGVLRQMNRVNVLLNGEIQVAIYFFAIIAGISLFIVVVNTGENRKNWHTIITNAPRFWNAEGAYGDSVSQAEIEAILDELKGSKHDKNTQEVELEPAILEEFLSPSLKLLNQYKDSEINKSDLISGVEAFGVTLQDKLERRFQIIRYFVTVIPSLGFIGTIIGISKALGQTSALTGESLPHERIFANETLGQSLYVAFDTTLIALLLSIVLSFFINWVENQEMSLVIEIRRNVLQRFSVIKEIV